ncbi:MAG: ABC transporter ATP-binding protein [Bacilli bacterium]|nr:ABC transporter ATP-binding protein [Bacilli bacterium]
MILELKNIKFTYPDGIEALHDINASIEKKSFVVVLGESGSGKTTLFKVISGIYNPDEGNVFIKDQDVTNIQTGSRDLTMIFQNFVLYPHLTIYHNVMVGLNGFEMDDEEKDRRVKNILSAFGLRNYLNFKPRHLSDGQKQRVCMCKALIREPSLFLMDEPLSNLDLPQRSKIKRELKDIFDSYDSTFIYITHDLKDAESLGTTIWVMDNGTIVQQGTIRELRESPKTLKVFSLVTGNNINIYQVRCDGKKLIHAGFAMDLEENRSKSAYTLAFAYKDAFIDPNGPIEGEILSAKIADNGQILLNVKLKDESLFSCYVDEEEEIKNGDLLRFNVKRTGIKLFQAKSK